MSNLKIGLYVGAWPQNIGNAFFDLGSRAILEMAFPKAAFYPLGGAVHWMFNTSARALKQNTQKFLHNNPFPIPAYGHSSNSLELGSYAEVDLIVFAGMSMCREFVETNGKTLLEASKKGVAILGLGTGANLYNNDELSSFSLFFNQLKKSAIITRDDNTYNMFKNCIKNIWSGIDCAFCLPEYYSPPALDLPEYNVENFDHARPSKPIDHGTKMIINTHHNLWGLLPAHYINKPNTLISDIPEDYLAIYSQASETYSDRVHACVASIAYGNKAQLFNKTPRKSLFEKVGIPEITSQLVTLNQSRREELKHKQVDQTRKFIELLINA